MRKLKLVTLLLGLTAGVMAQSIDYAKSLINQGKYLDAAKQLRPLADGGNDEAQYLAATLFFEGKGVPKDDARGIKYAILAANQGNEKGILLLVDYYEKVDAQKYVQAIKNYLKPIEYTGDVNDKLTCRLGLALVRGLGINKNIDKGWDMIRSSSWHLVFITERKIERDYYNYWTMKYGYKDMEAYCDYLYGKNDDDCSSVLEFILQEKGFDISTDTKTIYEYYLERANKGNGFAMAFVATYLLDKNKEEAITWVKKSKDLGSGFGCWLWNEHFSTSSTQ